jgi:hypothetical protein
MYNYLLEFYLEDFSEEIIKTEEREDEVEIFFFSARIEFFR